MKSVDWLVEYCKAQVGKPYWYGCFGQKSTEALYKSKKSQYPKYYTAKDYDKQYGVKVHDCAGLIKGALWSKTVDDPNPIYNSNQDFGANGFYNNAKVKGAIKTFPKKAGLIVFKGNATKKSHIGVYIGNDTVVEAKGHAYGVIYSKFTGGKWTYWAECSLIDYKLSTPTPIYKTYTVKVNSYLNVRTGPGKKYKSVAKLYNGNTVVVYEKSGNWGRIGVDKWVCMTYLK